MNIIKKQANLHVIFIMVLITVLLFVPILRSAATAMASTTPTQWADVKSFPISSGIIDEVSCASSVDCVAMGSDGDPLYSTVGGVTWKAGTIPTTSYLLSAVSCTNFLNCVAVGYNYTVSTGDVGVALISADGGVSWQAVTLPADISALSSVSCTNQYDCIAIGNYSPNQFGTAIEITTTDGGLNWSKITLPQADNGLESISCATALDCIAVGSYYNGSTTSGFAISTVNGGISWQADSMQTGITNLNYVTCPTALDCQSSGIYYDGYSYSPTVIHTTDGGLTWESGVFFDFVESILSISCETVSDCFAVEGQPNNGTATGALYQTTNGGSTWNEIPIPSDVGGLYGISCYSASNCIAGGIGIGDGPVVIRSNDSGVTWTDSSLPINGVTLNEISCPTVSNCVSVGDFQNSLGNVGIAVSTTNGGLTWNDFIFPQKLSSLLSVSCGSAFDCVAVGFYSDGSNFTGAIFSTTDGGLTWNQASTMPGLAYFQSVSCSNSLDCMTVGSNSKSLTVSLTSTDGGLAWNVNTAPPTIGDLFNVTCSSSTDCMAQGYESTTLNSSTTFSPEIYYTVDGGYNWNIATIPLNTDVITSISCVNSFDCLAVDYNGTSMSTSDGGMTWSQKSAAPAGTTLKSVSCSSVLDCTAVGYSLITGIPTAVAINTSDGGLTWSQEDLPPSAKELRGVSCPNALDCFTVGDGYNPNSYELILNTGPNINRVSPNTGDISIGTLVTITGSGFIGINTVMFGSTPATNFTVESGTTIKAISPPESLGTVNITVTGYGGTSQITNSDEFTYLNEGAYHPLNPTRIVDTRAGATDPSTYAGNSIGPGSSLDIPVINTDYDGVPSSATAVIANITALDSTQNNDYLTVYPTGIVRPNTSVLNINANERPVSNVVEIPIGLNGSISVFNYSGKVDVLIDIEGYVGPSSDMSGLFNPVNPFRIADTRMNSGYQYSGQTLSKGKILNLVVTGQSSGSNTIPSSNVEAVLLNITETNASSDGGYLTVYPTAALPNSPPDTSTLNFNAWQSVSNRVIVPVGVDGQISVYAGSSSADVVVDISGWFTGNSVSSTGNKFIPVSPVRIADSRDGSGLLLQGHPLQPGNLNELGNPDSIQTFGVSGDNIPSTAIAVVVNITTTNTTTNGGYLTEFPGNSAPQGTSDLNWNRGETVANCAIISLSSSGIFNVANAISSSDVIVDVTGYYVK